MNVNTIMFDNKTNGIKFSVKEEERVHQQEPWSSLRAALQHVFRRENEARQRHAGKKRKSRPSRVHMSSTRAPGGAGRRAGGGQGDGGDVVFRQHWVSV